MQNQKKPIQQKKPMQNFTAEKWADKIALFIDNFGFLSGFFWHWTIALPSPTSHLAMLHSKIILSDPNRRVKVVCIGFSLFWSRRRTWGTYSLLCCEIFLLPFRSLSVIIRITTKTFKYWSRNQCLVQLRRALASEAAEKRGAVRRRKGSQGLVKASWWLSLGGDYYHFDED